MVENALSFATSHYGKNSLAWLGFSTAQSLFPVGVLDAATLFGKQGEIDATYFMPGASVPDNGLGYF